jgi:hypothetical protein
MNSLVRILSQSDNAERALIHALGKVVSGVIRKSGRRIDLGFHSAAKRDLQPK